MDLSLPIQTTLAQSSLTLAYTWSPVLTNLLVGVFMIISIAMVLLVLIQRPQGGGLSGAFGAGGGGGGAGQTAFGTKTGDVLTMATITIFVLFLITAIVLNFGTRPQVAASGTATISTPAEEGTGAVGEAIEGENGEDADVAGEGAIADPEQAIEDAMSTTPGIESDQTQSGETPETEDASNTIPADEPVNNEPTGNDN
ncbi:MAG: preprotein translocase subunit SecG [Phycisphaerales bacterium JB052]